MRILVATWLLLAACGEDKGYGDPIDDPNAAAVAERTVTSASLLGADNPTTSDSDLQALNALSANMNLLAGIKLQQQQPADQYALDSERRSVDEACLVVTDTTVTYDNCVFAGNTVDGTISRTSGHIDIDLVFAYADIDTSTDIETLGSLDISSTRISGYLDFKVILATEDIRVTSRLDGDFDIVLSDGCAVDGEIEVHASASANGRSQDLWVKAEYGPTCGEIVVR